MYNPTCVFDIDIDLELCCIVFISFFLRTVQTSFEDRLPVIIIIINIISIIIIIIAMVIIIIIIIISTNKRALREDGKPEVTSIDLDESSGACETLTSCDVGNETRRKRP